MATRPLISGVARHLLSLVRISDHFQVFGEAMLHVVQMVAHFLVSGVARQSGLSLVRIPERLSVFGEAIFPFRLVQMAAHFLVSGVARYLLLPTRSVPVVWRAFVQLFVRTAASEIDRSRRSEQIARCPARNPGRLWASEPPDQLRP